MKVLTSVDNFGKMGNFSKTVSDALSSAEARKDELTREIGSIEFQEKNSFKAPPKEWIDHIGWRP